MALVIINQYCWHREKAQVGRSGLHSAIPTFARRDPGDLIGVSESPTLCELGTGVETIRPCTDTLRRQAQLR